MLWLVLFYQLLLKLLVPFYRSISYKIHQHSFKYILFLNYMKKLLSQKCIPCEGWVRPLNAQQIKPFLREIKGWTVIRVHELHQEFSFKDFAQAMRFVNKVARLAEQEGHH